MPWTKTDYPNSMKNLPQEVREKAIEIGNALLEETKMGGEGIIIATAISRAKDWAANRGKPTESRSKKSKTTDVKEHGEDRYVIPYGDDWAVKEEGEKEVETVYHQKKDAVRQAKTEAKRAKGAVTIQRKTGKVEKKISYNPRKTAKKMR